MDAQASVPLFVRSTSCAISGVIGDQISLSKGDRLSKTEKRELKALKNVSMTLFCAYFVDLSLARAFSF